MRWAYVDSSLVIATLFQDLSKKKLRKVWDSADRFISSYLLESEVMSATKREGVDPKLAQLEIQKLGFVRTGSLLREIELTLKVGYLRGADLFHVATALWIRSQHEDLKFLTLDTRQSEVAKLLGLDV